MATTSEIVLAALEASIKKIVSTARAAGHKLHTTSGLQDPVEAQSLTSGAERAFSVESWGGEAGVSNDRWHGSDTEEIRERFRITVVYPKEKDRRAQLIRIRKDVHDIRVKLDDPTEWATDVLHQQLVDWSPPEELEGEFVQRLLVAVSFVEATS